MRKELAQLMCVLALMLAALGCAMESPSAGPTVEPGPTLEPPISSSINAEIDAVQLSSPDRNVHANLALDLTIKSADNDFSHICTLKQAGTIVRVHLKSAAKDSLTNTLQVSPGGTVLAEIPRLAPGSYTLECDLAGHKVTSIPITAK